MSVTTTAPAAVAAPPSRSPLPYGLFSVLDFRDGATERWEAGGVSWTAASCDAAAGIGAPTCDPDNPPVGIPKDLTHGPSSGEASPFTVMADYACSPIPNSQQEAQRLALERLLAREEQRVEQALWTGDLGNVPNFSGANGFPAPVTVSSDGSLKDAAAQLEGHIASVYGSLGVLHTDRATATHLVTEGVAEVRGGRLLTKLGTPVVAGSGYPAENTIVATGAMLGYRGETYTHEGDLFDRGQNNLYGIAERGYLVGFDECVIAAATYGGAQ